MKRYISPQKNPKRTGFIIAFGAALMIGGHMLLGNFMGGDEPVETPQVSEVVVEEQSLAGADIENYLSAETEVFEEIAASTESSVIDEIVPVSEPEEIMPHDHALEIVKAEEQNWKEFAIPAELAGKTGKVVIIIDDVGMAHSLSNQTIDLPAPLTLAFLPYAPNLETMTARAKAEGHELMIHMPMEPMNADLDVGAIALLDDMSDAELQESLGKAFDSFEGYVGINNHMGSRLTQNEHAMHVVMNELAERGLLFVDSKTISTSVAGRVAAEHGLDYAERDVFLDHENSIEFVMNALRKLEITAKKQGYAIAIGHPKKATIAGLKQWLPTLKGKGLTVVPVSAVVKHGVQDDKIVAAVQKSKAVAAKVEPASGAVEIEPTPKLTDERFMLTPMPVQ